MWLDGDSVTGLEKIIKFGNVFQAQSANTTNTLFGDLPAMQKSRLPKIADCPHLVTDGTAGS